MGIKLKITRVTTDEMLLSGPISDAIRNRFDLKDTEVLHLGMTDIAYLKGVADGLRHSPTMNTHEIAIIERIIKEIENGITFELKHT